MQDFIFILILIAVIFGLIYFVYSMVLGAGKNRDDEDDLQISSNDFLEQLKLLYKQKKYHLAECMAKKYLEKKPHNDQIRTILTKCLYDNGKVYEAIENAKIIIKHQPSNDEIKILLAKFHVTTLKPLLAIATLNEILNDDPNNTKALSELAKIYLNTNQKKAAIKAYASLDELSTNNQDKMNIKNKLAELHIELGEYDMAIQSYKEILEIYPTDNVVLKKLIDLYMLSSDWILAIENAKELFDAHLNEENDFWALKILTEACSQSKDFENAMEYANLLKENALSNKVEAAQNIANILMNTDEVEKSTEILTQLVSENPKNTELKKSLAKAYETNKDFNSAAETYKKILDEVGAEDIIQIHYEMSNIFSNWAMYLFESNDMTECFKKFSTALKYNSQNPQIYYRLGLINQTIKNYNEAIAQYKKAIERDAENSSYYYALSECYQGIDNVYEEKKALIECIKHDPTNTMAHYKLGLICQSQRDLTNALAYMKQALALDNNFIDAKYHLALMLELKGEKESAIALYEQILKVNPEHQEALNNIKMLK